MPCRESIFKSLRLHRELKI